MIWGPGVCHLSKLMGRVLHLVPSALDLTEISSRVVLIILGLGFAGVSNPNDVSGPFKAQALGQVRSTKGE